MPSKYEMSDESIENKLKYFYRTKTDFNIDYNSTEKEAFSLRWTLSQTKIGNGS